MKQKNDSKYYSPKLLFSHNCITSFVMSPRGLGKTYGGKCLMVDNYKKKGKQSVYIRRSQAEMDICVKTFFDKIKKVYPDDEFEVKGKSGFQQGFINGEVFIHFIALSTSYNHKSGEFPDVTLIMFDEYIIPMNSTKRYLPNEMLLYLELISTIGRDRDDYRIYICANAISYVNPFFTFFEIEPDSSKRFQKFKDNTICLELFTSSKYREEIVKTQFGKMISGTKYFSYAVDNEVYEDTNDFIIDRDGKDYRFISSFKTRNYEIGVWLDLDRGIYLCDNKIDPMSKYKYYLRHDESQQGYQHIGIGRNETWRVKDIKRYFMESNLYFVNQEVKKFFQTEVIRFI